jgi:hypothetical protein
MVEKSVAQKLLVKPNSSVWSSHPDRLGLLGPLPEGVVPVADPGGATVALLFADDAASLRQVLEVNEHHLAEHSVLWVAYPKGNRVDINRDSLWPVRTAADFSGGDQRGVVGTAVPPTQGGRSPVLGGRIQVTGFRRRAWGKRPVVDPNLPAAPIEGARAPSNPCGRHPRRSPSPDR